MWTGGFTAPALEAFGYLILREITWERLLHRKSRPIAPGETTTGAACTLRPLRQSTNYGSTLPESAFLKPVAVLSTMIESSSSRPALSLALSVLLPTPEQTLLLRTCLLPSDLARQSWEAWQLYRNDLENGFVGSDVS